MINYYNYYLIAFNIEDGVKKPRIININKDMLKVEDDKELTNIAFIDNLTSQYSEDQFRTHLVKEGVIKDYDTPVFIVRHYKKNVKDSLGRTRANLKYYSPIFKSEEGRLVGSISKTTTQQRELMFLDAQYIIEYFKRLYNGKSDFRYIARYIINEHDIEHLLNYEPSNKNKNSSPIKYELLRDVVSAFYEFETKKSYEKFFYSVDGREDFTSEIFGMLPKRIANKDIKFKEPRELSFEEALEIKNSGWDDPISEKRFYEQLKQGTIYDRERLATTLEDKLRAGFISPEQYIRYKLINERLFRGNNIIKEESSVKKL